MITTFGFFQTTSAVHLLLCFPTFNTGFFNGWATRFWSIRRRNLDLILIIRIACAGFVASPHVRDTKFRESKREKDRENADGDNPIQATPYLSYTASCRTTAHANHVGFLKSLLGVKKATEMHCVLRETGQMPLFFCWFRCTVRFWNCLLNTNNSLLLKIVQADLRFANVQGSWTCQFLHALNDVPNSDTEFSEPVLARVSHTENMPCCGFSRSSL